MSNKRVNPHRQPASKADVEKARVEGRLQGAEFGALTLLFAQKDKCGATDEFIHESNEALQYMLDSIRKGYVNYEDMRSVLKDEYGITVEFT